MLFLNCACNFLFSERNRFAVQYKHLRIVVETEYLFPTALLKVFVQARMKLTTCYLEGSDGREC